jgi:hypothetical protein
MGCTTEREVIEIKLNKRLLMTTAAGVAVILSAVLLVSMGGNEKPSTNTNPPTNDEQPPASDTDVPATNTVPTVPATNDEDDEQAPDDHQGPGDNGNGNGNGGGSSDAPKKKGLERAIEVHERNIAKKIEKGNTNALKSLDSSKGLTHSLEVLKTNMDKHADQQSLQDGGNGHGLAKGHAVANP